MDLDEAPDEELILELLIRGEISLAKGRRAAAKFERSAQTSVIWLQEAWTAIDVIDRGLLIQRLQAEKETADPARAEAIERVRTLAWLQGTPKNARLIKPKFRRSA